MKKILFFFLTIVLFSCGGDGGVSTDLVSNPATASGNNSAKQPILTFVKTEHDFGTLIQGEQVSYSFHFTNTGNAPLLITGVEKACGCTQGKYDPKPVKPGDEGKIIISFDSTTKQGNQNIRIVVKANTNPSENILHIKADVKTPSNL